jgi:hypothetical protein
MDDEQLMEELIETLEDNGEIRLSSEDTEIFIQSIDGKEGYSYVSSTNKEFDDSREAIEWAVVQFDGIENIEEWE